LQELWAGNTQTFEQEVELPKHVAEAALHDGAYADVSQAQDAFAALHFQDAPSVAAAPSEPAFKDTGAVESSDDEGSNATPPAWACAYASAKSVNLFIVCLKLCLSIALLLQANALVIFMERRVICPRAASTQ
jgi:hypothetical protein